jgi:hypothetical protein
MVCSWIFSNNIDPSNNFEAKHLEEKRKENGISRIFTQYPQIRDQVWLISESIGVIWTHRNDYQCYVIGKMEKLPDILKTCENWIMVWNITL